MRLPLILSICLFLTACDRKGVLEKMTPKDDDVVARHFIDTLRTGDDTQIQLLLDPTLRNTPASSGFNALHQFLNRGTPTEIKEVGCNVFFRNGVRKTDLAYQLQYPDVWVIGDVVVKTEAGTATVMGAHFKSIPQSLEVLTRFSLAGKSPLEYIFLAVCVAVPCFIIFALIVCIRTPVRRKWLWILFILFAIVQFRLNWITGKKDVQPLSIVLLGSGCFKSSPYAPWILDFGLPVGALVFLFSRKKLKTPETKTPPVS